MVRKFILGGTAALALQCGTLHAQSTVQLLDAGAAPRETLRYQFTAGSSEHADMDMSMQMSLAQGNQEIPVANVPPIRMGMEMRVAEVAEDGSARLEFELQSAKASGSQSEVAQLNNSLEAVTGLSGWYRMDVRGRILEGRIHPRQGQDNQGMEEMLGDIQESMQQMAQPLPEEAVGAGARWQVTQLADAGAMRVSQTMEYTLRSRNGSLVTLDVKVIDAQLETGTALPDGVKVDSVKVSGGGTTRMELDRLVPVAMADVQTNLTMSEARSAQSMGINVKMRHAIAPSAPQATP